MKKSLEKAHQEFCAHKQDFLRQLGVASGLLVLIFLIPNKLNLFPSLRLGLTLSVFLGVFFVLSLCLSPARELATKWVEFRYAGARSDILDGALWLVKSVYVYLLPFILLTCALLGFTLLRVLSCWPIFRPVLEPLSTFLWMGWWVVFLSMPLTVMLTRSRLIELIRSSRLHFQNAMGFEPNTESNMKQRVEERKNLGAVKILGDGCFRAASFDFRFSDFTKNAIIFGQSGSGKTVCVLNSLLEGLLGSSTNLGGLILDPKGDYLEKINILAKKYNREKDLLILNPYEKDSFIYNPLDSDDDALEIASRITTGMQLLGSGKGNDTFWIDSARTALRHAIQLLRLQDDGKVGSLEDVLRLVSGFVDAEGNMVPDSLCASLIMKLTEGSMQESKLAAEYFTGVWFKMAPNTRSSVVAQLSTLIDAFSLPPYNRVFAGKSTMRLGDVVEQGKLLYVYMPIADKEQMSKLVCTFIKSDYFRQVLIRPNKKTPSFFLCDEFQSFIAEGAGSGADSNFFERSRQSNHANIIATQNMPALLKNISEESTLNLLGNCATKIFLRNTDQRTNEYASNLFGVQSSARVHTQAAGSEIVETELIPKQRFVSLSQPDAENQINYTSSIVSFGARGAVSCEQLDWIVNPIN